MTLLAIVAPIAVATIIYVTVMRLIAGRDSAQETERWEQ